MNAIVKRITAAALTAILLVPVSGTAQAEQDKVRLVTVLAARD